MKSMLLFIFIVLSSKARATTGRAFGLINTTNSFADDGSIAGIGGRIEANIKGEGYGIGGEYKFDLPNKFFSIRAGLIYELERKVDQLTTFISGYTDSNGDYVNGDIESSQENMPSIQMTTIYSNLHLQITENINCVAGLGYYSPNVTTKGSYDVDPGLGYQFGLDFELQDNFFIQVLKRKILLASKAGSYKGTADLSSLALLVGKDF